MGGSRFTVLGAGGFIGRNLAARLRQTGHAVLTPGRGSLGHLRDQPLGHVIYCIGVTADFRQRPLDTVEAHVGALGDLLRGADLASLLYLSSTRVYARAGDAREDALLPASPRDPSDLYNLSKMMGEALCLNAGGPRARVVRLANVVGLDPLSQNFLPAIVRQALDGRIVLQSTLASAKNYVVLEDVLDLLPRIAEHGASDVYNVAGERNVSHREIVDRLAELTGCTVTVAPGAVEQSFPPIPIERIRREFGFRPRDPLAELASIVAAHRRHAAAGSGGPPGRDP